MSSFYVEKLFYREKTRKTWIVNKSVLLSTKENQVFGVVTDGNRERIIPTRRPGRCRTTYDMGVFPDRDNSAEIIVEKVAIANRATTA